MGLDTSLKKILILGSGPIIIGQAAEFDYSGTQACKAIREEGIETILINSNPATIMTDENIADSVYIEPLNIECLTRVIERERPDGILASFGGQTALNLAMKLQEAGVLDEYKVRLLGINAVAIKKAEDRDEFKKLMVETNQPIPASIIATSLPQCETFAAEVGYPLIIRPAYTLGGTGGGFATDIDELREVCARGIKLSPIGQILLERSVAGWKELEYEVVRDHKDNCIIICNMENLDPVGIHTGDSIVVAPSQTLRDKEYHMLRKAAVDIIRSLKIEGGCNIQFALDPASSDYIVIEVNPRVSRSSALASKATGYPIAKIAAKIAIGYSLDELKNYVTGTSSACFEPALDYVVTKIPKWPFDKFGRAERRLGTQMKATGEVMAISRNFESSLLKAITSLDGKFSGLKILSLEALNDDDLIAKIKKQDDQRIFAVAAAFRRGMEIDALHAITKIDHWFLNGILNIIKMERRLAAEPMSKDLLLAAETLGFTDEDICHYSEECVDVVEALRKAHNIYPIYKMVDTCSGEFEAETPYYYSCYETEDENIITQDKKVLIIGSGPIRIGQGIEFDYCCVHGAWAVREAGYKAIMLNNNPETVSTDFDTADKLYFEPIHIDDIMNVIYHEKPIGTIVQLGGQTSIHIAKELALRGQPILGTPFDAIDLAEDRERFRKFLSDLKIPTPHGVAVESIEEAFSAADHIGYPVVVRPSYVIGGRAMEVVYDREQLEKYMREAATASDEKQILIDKYVQGTEVDVDAIADGSEILIPGIMEHVERTGVHSGDSISIYPYFTLDEDVVETLIDYTRRIVKAMGVIGLVNVQYAIEGKQIYVIEVNPRASRTVPILSKITGIPMVKIAVELMLGRKLRELPYGTGLLRNRDLIAVKVPVFSGEKLVDADTYLGPEMKSTGEVLGVDKRMEAAIYKGFVASGVTVVTGGKLYASLKDPDKKDGVEILREYLALGFTLHASEGTAEFLKSNGLPCEFIPIDQALNLFAKGEIDMVVNSQTKGNNLLSHGFRLRRKAAEHRIPIFTCIDTARIFLAAIRVKQSGAEVTYRTMQEYLGGPQKHRPRIGCLA